MRSPASWSLSLLSRERAPTLPPWGERARWAMLRQADHLLTFCHWPVDALRGQAGGGEDLFDVRLPAGRLQLAEPAVHAVGLVVTRLHQLDEALLQDAGPGHRCETLIYSSSDCSIPQDTPTHPHTFQRLCGSVSTGGSWLQTQSLLLGLWPAGPHWWCACRWCSHVCPGAAWRWSASRPPCSAARWCPWGAELPASSPESRREAADACAWFTAGTVWSYLITMPFFLW